LASSRVSALVAAILALGFLEIFEAGGKKRKKLGVFSGEMTKAV